MMEENANMVCADTISRRGEREGQSAHRRTNRKRRKPPSTALTACPIQRGAFCESKRPGCGIHVPVPVKERDEAAQTASRLGDNVQSV